MISTLIRCGSAGCSSWSRTSPAHLKSILANYCAFFPVENGAIVKGSRQVIYFAEYDGPLCRAYCVRVIGE
ncbi:MAG TPA: YjbQ family protein [bacterium]|nr:YjbQ family protein [bacterium]